MNPVVARLRRMAIVWLWVGPVLLVGGILLCIVFSMLGSQQQLLDYPNSPTYRNGWIAQSGHAEGWFLLGKLFAFVATLGLALLVAGVSLSSRVAKLNRVPVVRSTAASELPRDR